MRIYFFIILGTLGISCSSGNKTADKPNIIYILADDLGYGELGVGWVPNRNTFTLMYRPASEGDALQLTWSYPISRVFRIYAQYYNGTGESLIDYDETFYYEEEIVSGKPVDVKVELERRFDANVVLWADDAPPADWNSDEPGAYVDLHQVAGRKERVDQNHVKYFLDLNPGEKRFVKYSVTYKRRKMGPELNQEKKREPL